jgi:DNA repair protein RecO
MSDVPIFGHGHRQGFFMDKITTEGIVINAIPFRNYDCILTLFTPLEGLIKLFFRGAYNPKKGNGAGAVTPLSIVEAIYTKGRTELHTCQEMVVVDHNLALRQHLAMLNAACDMLRSIVATQQPGKAAPELYKLFRYYLNKLPQTSFPQAIVGSFRLKLMRYEGLLSFFSHCCECSGILNDVWISGGEAYCYTHKPLEAHFLTKEEKALVERLAFCRDFALLAETEISAGLSAKIGHLFDTFSAQ